MSNMQYNLLNLRREARQILLDAGHAEPEAAANCLLCDVLGISRTEMFLGQGRAVPDEVAADIIGKARRMAASEPLQYVVGFAYFMDCKFHVDANVLIPRPETETLVRLAVEFGGKMPEANVLDIGTGSGCIALMTKRLLPDAHVSAIDISAGALSVARLNAAEFGAEVDFRQADILAADAPAGVFDIIISNPPYVCEREKHDMDTNVLDHEPHTALFVPDDDPLLFYRAIANHCRRGMLAAGGKLLFETNAAYAAAVAELLRQQGFTDVKVIDDCFGKPRFVSATNAG